MKETNGSVKVRNVTVLARPSRTADGELRILRDTNVAVGRTAGPMVFKNAPAAEKYVKESNLGSEGFLPMVLGLPRPSGATRHRAKKGK